MHDSLRGELGGRLVRTGSQRPMSLCPNCLGQWPQRAGSTEVLPCRVCPADQRQNHALPSHEPAKRDAQRTRTQHQSHTDADLLLGVSGRSLRKVSAFSRDAHGKNREYVLAWAHRARRRFRGIGIRRRLAHIARRTQQLHAGAGAFDTRTAGDRHRRSSPEQQSAGEPLWVACHSGSRISRASPRAPSTRAWTE